MAHHLKILLVSEYIAPVQAIASIRWSKLTKYLKQHHNAGVDVLTNVKRYGPMAGFGRYLLDENTQDQKHFDQVYELPNRFNVEII